MSKMGEESPTYKATCGFYSQYSRFLKIWLSSDRFFVMILTIYFNIRYCLKIPLMISMLFAQIAALQYIFKAGDYFKHFVQI